MKKLFTLVYALFAFVPFAGFAGNGLSPQAVCSDQITLTYYVSGVLTTQTINNGQSGGSIPVCPSAGALYSLSASSSSDAVITVTKVITKGVNNPAADVVESPAIGSATRPPNTPLSVSLSFATTTIFRVESKATGSCTKHGFVYITFTPTLTLVSNAPVSGVCNGGAVTLTAAGSTSGTYTWSANGVVIPGKTSSSITANPIDNTTYTVSTTTSCGTSSQQITIPVKTLSISPNAPFACTKQSTIITASYNGPSATYSWSILGQPTFATTATVTVAPEFTTTYQVVAHTGDCGDITKTVTVTVGAPTVSVAPTAATVCSGIPTTLRASSNNPSAVFTWLSDAGSILTGSSVTVSPTTSTNYTVTATTACGSPTATVALTVVSTPTFSISPASASATICAGASTTLTAGSNITGATYAWYKSTDLGTLLSSAASLTVVPATTTTYRVLTTTPCGNNSQDVTVTVNPVPNVTINPTAVTITRGNSISLTASGAATYSWSPAAGLNTTSGATVTASPTTTTTYTVTGTNPTGCSNTNQVTVTVNNPLPVELMTFTARSAGPVSVLNWATATEYNNDYFAVERSADGLAFALLGQVAGAGTSSSLRSYSFTDERPPVAVAYYRLRQVDYIGAATYSPVVSVTSIRHPGDWLVRTALARHYLIQGALDASSRFTVLDVMGRNVFGQAVAPDRAEVVIPALPAGVYLFQLSTQQGRFTVRQSVTAAE